jgi:hypothetical protein
VRSEIVTAVARNPHLGDLMVGTGGLRKFRFARPGGGKSGGYRILSYYVSDGFPVFLIGAFAKNQKENVSPSERVELGKRLKIMSDTYAKKAGLK